MLLITVICTVFGILLQRQLDDKTAEIIAGKQESAALLAETILAEVVHNYSKRIISFSNAGFSSRRELMIRAFAKRDRAELLRLSQPLVKVLKKENAYFATVGWILPDNRVFLRTHNPEKFGDDVGGLRVDIATVNKQHQQQAGFDVGTHSMQYRVVQPVYYHNEYLGAVESPTM